MASNPENLKISAVIIAFNEEDRLPAALDNLKGTVDEIVVVDGFSADRTAEIARAMGAHVFQNEFSDFASQKNYAMQKARNDWILNIDADERLDEDLKLSLAGLKADGPHSQLAGFSMHRKTFYLGRWILHSGWYPDKKIRLFKKTKSHWQGRIHERLVVAGAVGHLHGAILHYTYRDLADHFRRINHYSSLQAEDIIKKRKKCLLARSIFLPLTTFIRHYFVRLGFLDGFAGFVIALLSSWATALKYLKALEWKRSHPAP